MDDIGILHSDVLGWFVHSQDNPFVLVKVPEDVSSQWPEQLRTALRRCYSSDANLITRAAEATTVPTEVLGALLPDAGATMSGDFGEIVTFLYQGSRIPAATSVGSRKWRYKGDKTKPAPYSDVVHVVLPSWPHASTEDELHCSEVKTKATAGDFAPIEQAIVGCEKDRTSRLARTLVWLRRMAITRGQSDIDVDRLNRFINASDHPTFKRVFRAVAVVCTSLLDNELQDAPTLLPANYVVVVISIAGLKQLYTDCFANAHLSAERVAT